MYQLSSSSYIGFWTVSAQLAATEDLECDWQNFCSELQFMQAKVLHMQDLCHALMHFCIPNAK